MCVCVSEAAVSDGELDLTGIDDSELDQFIMSKEEVRRKAVWWVREHADYLKEQKRTSYLYLVVP